MGAIVDDTTNEVVDCWYELGKKLCTGDRKIICEPREGEDRRHVHVYCANDGDPVKFREATREAFQGLLIRRLIEEGSIGRNAKKLTGYVITGTGRRRIGGFDIKGNPLSSHVNNDIFITPRELPVAGFTNKAGRPSRAQPSRARTTRKV